LKILHVIPSLAAGDGGPTHAVLAMERVLQSQGIKVDIATSVNSSSVAKAEAENRLHFNRLVEFYKVAPGFLWWLAWNVRRYDVLHIHALFSFMSVAAALACRLRGVPYILRPLGTLSQYGIHRRRPLLKKLSLLLIEGPMLRHSAAVHFTAEQESVEASLTGIPMRSVVLPLGVDEFVMPEPAAVQAAKQLVSGNRVVLYMSRIDPKKNPESVLQAFAGLYPAFPHHCLVMAGSGEQDYVAELKSLASRLGIGDAVLWPGFVAGPTKSGLLAIADVFVLPSHSENFGIAAAEAMMAGLPCILGHGVALAQEAEAAGAAISVSSDAKDVATALQVVLSDSGRLASMRIAASQLALARYSLAAMGLGLVELYRSVQKRSVPQV